VNLAGWVRYAVYWRSVGFAQNYEYRQFVEAMPYADDEDNISFKAAIDSFDRLAALFG